MAAIITIIISIRRGFRMIGSDTSLEEKKSGRRRENTLNGVSVEENTAFLQLQHLSLLLRAQMKIEGRRMAKMGFRSAGSFGKDLVLFVSGFF